MLCPKLLEQVGDGGAGLGLDFLRVTNCFEVCMKCGVNSVHRMGRSCTLDQRVGISQCALQDIAGDRWTAVLDRKSISTARGQFQQPAVSLLSSKVLTALGILTSDAPKDCCLLMSFDPRQDCNKSFPGRVAGEGIRIQVQVAKAWVELSMCLVGEITQVAAFNPDVAVNHPVNLTASQLAHRAPLNGWNTRYIESIIVSARCGGGGALDTRQTPLQGESRWTRRQWGR
ncbi:hypothetical protein CPBF424_18910 [Xanthomonas euroxanthea]|uniref:Uncharacterized protein n=1 Tax=Xanthomonas euroxanthea TaxID=2259622 RepID=A0AA46C7V7_9XANT|nr:hypothetical protein CPBF424_18910 [Xanthomonas euroxanthea]